MTLAVAHRGDPRAAVENTLDGIVRAAGLGANAIEVDLRLTRDGVVVLHHDVGLQRVWRRPESIGDLDFAGLRERVPQIPTLAEALKALSSRCTPLVLDVADPDTALAGLAELRRVGGNAWFCGAGAALAQVREQDRTATILLSWNEQPPAAALIEEVRPQYVNPEHRQLDPDTVRRWQQRGYRVCTWTVDDRERRRALIRWGVDAVISNDVAGAVLDTVCQETGETYGRR